ncbi:hypothetical protein LY13_001870 [Prauserella aidingensis]|uniref:hypothetical protein n=1 Tax=Prauserella aidingensis TaxID=387890 RepID=UPI0020A49CB7|nr:hypothetical protein [Prauserella aidingensis]MCP2253122.1 hypothetical protein [Prauserella aidingensis]
MRPHLTLLATVAAGAVVLAGCGGGETDNAGGQGGPASGSASSLASPGPSGSQQGGQGDAQVSQEGVRWIDGFCGSLAEFSASSQGTPPPQSQDPAAVKKSMTTMLGAITQGVDKFLADMNAMGSSPTEGGDQFLATAKESYKKLRSTAGEAKTELDKAPDSDQATKQAVQSASSKLQQVDLQKPIKQLQSNPQLSGEFQQAPECRKLLQAAQQQQGGQQQPPQQQPQQPQPQQPQQPGN